jgi:hypothetical protein
MKLAVMEHRQNFAPYFKCLLKNFHSKISSIIRHHLDLPPHVLLRLLGTEEERKTFQAGFVDPHSYNADPDPAFFLIADPDPVPNPGF